MNVLYMMLQVLGEMLATTYTFDSVALLQLLVAHVFDVSRCVNECYCIEKVTPECINIFCIVY